MLSRKRNLSLCTPTPTPSTSTAPDSIESLKARRRAAYLHARAARRPADNANNNNDDDEDGGGDALQRTAAANVCTARAKRSANEQAAWPAGAALDDAPVFSTKRSRVVPPAAPLPEGLDEDDQPVVTGLQPADPGLNDVELDQPGLQLVPYVQPSWQRAALGPREVEIVLQPRLKDLVSALPRLYPARDEDSSSDNDADDEALNDVLLDEPPLDDDAYADVPTLTEPPSPWTLVSVGGHGAQDGTAAFFNCLGQATRISVVRVVPDNDTPLELLQTIDISSPSFQSACAFLQEHQSDFSSLNLNFGYDDSASASGGSSGRQLVASHRGSASATALWPNAAAFNNETRELIVLVAQGSRRHFPWAKVVRAFE